LFGNKSIAVQADADDPLITADNLQSALEGVSRAEPQKYLVDITTFTHESLLILLRLLGLRLKRSDNITFAYTGAADYDPGNKGTEKWLSKGMSYVRSVLGFPGAVDPSRKTHLIVLVGFEHERALGVIEQCEPSLISLGCSAPGTSTRPTHGTANEMFYKLLRDTVAYPGVKQFTFPCNDPWGVRDAVLRQSQLQPGYNIVVCPMNNKISTIGVGLCALQEDSVQLCYAKPSQYNYRNYSSPGESCYLFEVPNLVELSRDLSAATR
jgi:hypothetical protein